MPTPLSSDAIAKIRAGLKAQNKLGQAPQFSTAGDAFANGVRDTNVIGTYQNTGSNGYSAASGMSQVAINAQKRNQQLYNQQVQNAANQTVGTPVNPNPTAEELGRMNANPSTIGADIMKNNVNGRDTAPRPTPKIPLEFGKNVATPTVGTATTNGSTNPATPGSTPTTPPTNGASLPTDTNNGGENANTPGNTTPGDTGVNNASNTTGGLPPSDLANTGGRGTNTPSMGAPTGDQTNPGTGNQFDPYADAANSFNGQINAVGGLSQTAQNLAQMQYNSAEEARRRQLIRTLGQTNASDIASSMGQELGSLTTAQLEDLATASGLDLSQKVKDRLSAGGQAEIENLKMEQTMNLATNEMTRRQLERTLGRNVSDREEFNANQDTALKLMMGSFGGGKAETLSGNMAIMQEAEKGQRYIDDLKADYADKNHILGLEAQQIWSKYTNNVNKIQSDTAGMIEDAYAQLSQTVDDLLNKGVTNKTELAKGIYQAKESYVNKYVDITSKALEYYQTENKNLFDQSMALKQESRAYDQMLMGASGFMYENGSIVKDQYGNAVPTFDRTKWNSEEDFNRSQLEGIIYRNGEPLINAATGKPIGTFDAQKFMMQQDLAERQMNLSENQFSWNKTMDKLNYQSAEDKRMTDATGYMYSGGQPVMGADGQPMTTLDAQKFTQQMKDSAISNTKTLIDSGVLPKTAMNKFLSPEDVIANSVYVSRGENGLSKAVRNIGDVVSQALKSSPYGNNCVQFVRSIVPDMPTGLYTLQDKINNLLKSPGALEAPEPGAVVVMSTGQPAGHVAFVTGVDKQNGKIYLAEANWKAGQTGTREMDLNDPRIQGYWKSQNVQQGGAQLPPDAQNTFNLVSTNMSKEQRENNMKVYQDYINRGDMQGANNYINQIAVQSLPAAERTDYGNFKNVNSEMDRVISQYSDKTINGGIYANLVNDNRKFFNIEQDPTLRDFYADVTQAQSAYRKSLFGSSVTDTEQKAGAQFLIDPTKDTIKDVFAKVKAQRDFAARKAEGILDVARGTSSNSVPAGSVMMKAPDGTPVAVAKDEIEQAKKNGFTQ